MKPKYLNELFDPFNNKENILQKLPKIIEDDYHSRQKPEKDSILSKINNHINEINFQLKTNKIKTFQYKLSTPISGIDYELSFTKENNPKSKIHFNNLSTGEKAFFELLFYAYSHSSKKDQVKYFLLDEFDANFNPTLIKAYVYLLNSLKDKIKIIITTHNPITVFTAEYNEIYELNRDKCLLKKSNDENDKKEILEKLAPDFIHNSELGFIGVLSKTTKDTIILCDGEQNIKNCINCFKTIPILRDLISSKKIVALFDFDNAVTTLKNLIGEITENKYMGKIDIKKIIKQSDIFML